MNFTKKHIMAFVFATCLVTTSCATDYKWSAADASEEQTSTDLKACKKEADKIAFNAIPHDTSFYSDSFSYSGDNNVRELDRIEAKKIFNHALKRCMENRGYKKIKIENK
jgi:PBP1b-binding outer membrane lipoprotein LpoB